MHFAMEEMIMGKQNFMISNNNTSTTPSSCFNSLGIRKDSRSVSKVKPKIRIIHIFAPEIIKTDVANFRELVQRLTGKPAENNSPAGKGAASSVISSGKIRKSRKIPAARSNINQEGPATVMMRKMMETPNFISSNNNGTATSHEDFCFTFPDIDGFIQDISELPLLPVHASLHHVHPFESHRAKFNKHKVEGSSCK